MKKQNWQRRGLVLAIPWILLALVFLCRPLIYQAAGLFPQCPFYRITGLYCPACGNTRSALAMLRLDFFAALRYNATLPLLAGFGILFYLELVFFVFGKRVRLVPRKNWFLALVIGGLLVYYLVRNFF